MSCRYDDVPTVKQFHRRFRIPGGKSVPKMIVCVGSDGKERRQLVKVSQKKRSFCRRRIPNIP